MKENAWMIWVDDDIFFCVCVCVRKKNVYKDLCQNFLTVLHFTNEISETH